MEIPLLILILATLLCSLVAGFLFAFAIVVMPGIGKLDDPGFIRAFQTIDGIIQNNQPLFMVVWLGSIIALLAAAAFAIGQLDVPGRAMVIVATVAWLLGVQLPTFTINVPLNNRLQSLNVGVTDAPAQAEARAAFEARWNRWNAIRTVVSCGVSLLLIVVVARS